MENCPHPRPECKYPEPFADDHHEVWPACDYKTPLEKRYRSLEVNILRGVCRCLHDMRHQLPPPEKPAREVMLEAIAAERAKRGR